MRNLLSSFDEFQGNEILSERDFQDYLGRYQDLHDEWKEKMKRGVSKDIVNDVVFEIELIKQIEINIDYILMLVSKYHGTHCADKEILVTIRKAVDASPELRSKKQLIESRIAGIEAVDAVITEENLKPDETRKFIEHSFRDGEIKTTGTDIEKIMPPASRFGGGGKAAKKQAVIGKLKAFFEKYSGLGSFKA